MVKRTHITDQGEKIDLIVSKDEKEIIETAEFSKVKEFLAPFFPGEEITFEHAKRFTQIKYLLGAFLYQHVTGSGRRLKKLLNTPYGELKANPEKLKEIKDKQEKQYKYILPIIKKITVQSLENTPVRLFEGIEPGTKKSEVIKKIGEIVDLAQRSQAGDNAAHAIIQKMIEDIKTKPRKVKQTKRGPVIQGLEYYHSPENFERQKLKTLDGNQYAFKFNGQNDAPELDITGLDLGTTEEIVLGSLQQFFAISGYRGNDTPMRYKGNNPWNYSGDVPALKIKVTDFLDMCGVNKRITSRGKSEYNSNERSKTLKTLFDLSEKKFNLIISQEKGPGKYDVLRLRDTLFRIPAETFRNVTTTEKKHILTGGGPADKLTEIYIHFSPLLFAEINKRYIKVPFDHTLRIKQNFPGASKYLYRFCSYLFTEYSARRRDANIKKTRPNLTIRINYKILADKLKMSAVDRRMWTKARNDLIKIYDQCKKLGYLKSYKIDQGGKTKTVDILRLNEKAFPKDKEREITG